MITSSASRIVETACWVLGVALATGYFSARAYGEIERRQQLSAFTESRLLAASDVDAEPDDQRQGLELTIPADAGLIAGTGLPETKMNELRGIRLGAALIGLICAGTVSSRGQELKLLGGLGLTIRRRFFAGSG